MRGTMGELQRHFINTFPSWVCILLLVLGLTVLVWGLFRFLNRFFPHWIHKENSSFLPTVTIVTSANYGFLLGFVVIVLWQAFNTAQSVTTAEANRLALFMYDIQAFPKDVQGQLSQGVGKYINILIKDEWPAMKKGDALPEADEALNALFPVMQKYTPETDVQKVFYREALSNINQAIEKRRERLATIDSILTDPLRFLLLLGIFIITFFLTLIASENRRVHTMAVVLVGCVVAFNMGVAMNLDFPFSGDVCVGNEAFTQGILAQFKPH